MAVVCYVFMNGIVLMFIVHVWLPVGVRPNEYCEPSLPRTVWVSTPYISRSLANDKYSLSASEGLLPLKIKSCTAY